MVTESPPVSPSFVAAILMIQNPSVTAGILLRPVEPLSIVKSIHPVDPKASSERTPNPFPRRSSDSPSSLQAAYSFRFYSASALKFGHARWHGNGLPS